MANQPIMDKNSREYQEQMIRSGRSFLLTLLLLSVINLVLLVLDVGYYLLFSASVPYYLTAFGISMDLGATGTMGTFTATALVIGAVILAVYLVCWLLSKKHHIWLTVAAVLFAIDTVILVLLGVRLDMLVDCILDLLFHAYVLFVLIRGAIAAGKLKRMSREVFDSGALGYTPELD